MDGEQNVDATNEVTDAQNTPEQEVKADAAVDAGSEDSGRSSLLGDVDKPAAPVVPESYSFEVPEGMTLTDSQKSAFENDMKELGLTQEQAQAMLAKSHANTQAYQAAHQQQVQKWGEQVRDDPEMGGANFEATGRYADDAIKRFDTDERLFNMLKETGYCKHPDVIRFLASVGRSFGEDGVILGGKTQQDKAPWEVLYGKS